MTPFKQALVDPEELEKAVQDSREYARRHGLDEDQTVITAREAITGGTWWVNDQYQVTMREAELPPGWPPMVWLSIRRQDRQPIHDWRELQAIKNELVGPDHEGVELYPAESRLVDTANQYHLWVMRDPDTWFPFGFGVRVVSEEPIGKSVQRPFNGRA